MNILFLLPNPSSSASSFSELIDRHIMYVSKIRDVDPQGSFQGLVIVGKPIRSTESLESEYLKLRFIHPSLRLLPFSISAWLTIKRIGFKPTWIVAGDPFTSFLKASALNFLLGNKGSIQVSFHGEIRQLRRKSVKNSIKIFMLYLSYRFADLMRFVSYSQAEDVASFFKYKRSNTVVVPVPINPPNYTSPSMEKSYISFVGRIHEERGIEEWALISGQVKNLKQLIVGDGPMFDKFKKSCPKGEFLGSMSHYLVQKQWEKIAILLSTAPYESYGLAMREALLHRVPVVSRRNLGSMELNARYPQLVAIYDSTDEAVLQIMKLLEMQSSRLNLDEYNRFRNNFIEEQDQSLKILARCWLNEI